MIQLPKSNVDPEFTKDVCKCRPICKSRNRYWNGVLQKPSAELALERKPKPDCVRRWPKKVYPNSPCPLFARKHKIFVKERKEKLGFHPNPTVVRICGAPIDVNFATKYLELSELAKQKGALSLVSACCPFCDCGCSCLCGNKEYMMKDPERKTYRPRDMDAFNSRVKDTYKERRNLYDS